MYENACYFLQRRTTTGYDFTIYNFMVSALNIKKAAAAAATTATAATATKTTTAATATKHNVQLYVHTCITFYGIV